MCRIAYCRFDDSVSQADRHTKVALLLKNSWELGNKDGAGVVTWDGNEPATTARTLHLDTFVLPHTIGRNVLIHARHATCEVSLRNTHPISAAGAHLVHNGIVYPQGEDNTLMLSKVVRTTNDSEFILKGYLASDRDLFKAHTKFEGWANIMLWDERREVLSIYADNEDFQLYRQSGCLYMVQERAQIVGLIFSGLGHPYEFQSVPQDKVFEIELSRFDATDFAGAWAAAVASGRAVTTAYHQYSAPSYSQYSSQYNYPYANGEVRGPSPTFRYGHLNSGAVYTGGTIAHTEVQTGLARLANQEREEIAKENSASREARVFEVPPIGAKEASDGEGFRDAADEREESEYAAQRRRWSLSVAFEKYQHSGGPDEWNEFVAQAEKKARQIER